MRSFLLISLFAPSMALAQEPITLDGARQKAAQAFEDVQVAQQRVERAKAVRREALAGMLPRLSVNASGTYNGVEVELNGRNIVQQFDWSAGGRASVTVFDGSLYPTYDAAQYAEAAAHKSAEWTTHVVDYEVAQAFFALAAAERQLAIAQRASELRKSYTERAAALSEQGIGLPLDVSRARAQELQAQQDVLLATAQLETASDALGILLAAESQTFRADTSALERVPPPPSPASQQRADLEAAARSIDAAKSREAAIWWGLLPTVELSANSRFGPTSLSNPDGFVWSLSLDATWLLYDGGARYARAAQLSADTEILNLELARTQRTIGAQTRQALRDWRASHEAIDVASEQRDVAQQTYDMTLARAESGLATSIEVVQASEELYRAEINLNAAQLAADLAAARYRFVTGDSQ